MGRKFLLIILGILVILLLSLGAYYFVTQTEPKYKGVSVDTTQSLGHKVSIIDEGSLLERLGSEGVISSDGVSKLDISVKKELDDPFYVQQDRDGNMLVSAYLSITDDVAKIEIGVSDYVLSDAVENKGAWIDSAFWRAMDLLSKRQNRAGISDELKKISVFQVE